MASTASEMSSSELMCDDDPLKIRKSKRNSGPPECYSPSNQYSAASSPASSLQSELPPISDDEDVSDEGNCLSHAEKAVEKNTQLAASKKRPHVGVAKRSEQPTDVRTPFPPPSILQKNKSKETETGNPR